VSVPALRGYRQGDDVMPGEREDPAGDGKGGKNRSAEKERAKPDP